MGVYPDLVAARIFCFLHGLPCLFANYRKGEWEMNFLWPKFAIRDSWLRYIDKDRSTQEKEKIDQPRAYK